MLDSLLTLLPTFGLADVVDVALVAILLYVLFLALKQTRTTFVIVGVVMLAALYVAAISFELRLTRFLFQLVFAVALVAVIVIFHDELRVAAERFLSWRLRWHRPHAGHGDSAHGLVVETLIGTLTDLARERVGALIVLRGRDNPSAFIRGGARLDGVLSEPLLKSIFDPHSLGHDGAILMADDRVERFGCHLPLSTNSGKIGKHGTRHAAALGISEKVDCLCLVVSEERGTISVARHGNLDVVDDLAQLNRLLADFFVEISPVRPRASWRDALLRYPVLKLASVALAFVLWFLVVHESTIEYRQFIVEPTAIGLRDGLRASIEPQRLRVVVSGPRRSFYFKRAEHFHVDVTLFDRLPGTYDIYLTATDVTLPEGISFINIAPTRNVRVTVTP